MCLIKGEIYIATKKNSLHVFDEKLNRTRDIQLVQLERIYGVNPLLNETLIVAADSGLFHINQQDKK